MNRVLTWNALGYTGNLLSIGATYYMEADYEPVAVRIYAEEAPSCGDAEFNIYDDGVSIFDNKASTTYDSVGTETYPAPDTNIFLCEGENEEVEAENFETGLLIEKGSWVSCNLIADGGGKNFSVHLELRQISEDDESED